MKDAIYEKLTKKNPIRIVLEKIEQDNKKIQLVNKPTNYTQIDMNKQEIMLLTTGEISAAGS